MYIRPFRMALPVLTAEEVEEVLREAEMELLTKFVQELWCSATSATPGVSAETEMVKTTSYRLKVSFLERNLHWFVEAKK